MRRGDVGRFAGPDCGRAEQSLRQYKPKPKKGQTRQGMTCARDNVCARQAPKLTANRMTSATMR